MILYYEKYPGECLNISYERRIPPPLPLEKLPPDSRKRFVAGDIVRPCFVPIDAYPHTTKLQIRAKQPLVVETTTLKVLKEGKVQLLSFKDLNGSYESDFFEKVDA